MQSLSWSLTMQSLSLNKSPWSCFVTVFSIAYTLKFDQRSQRVTAHEAKQHTDRNTLRFLLAAGGHAALQCNFSAIFGLLV